MSIDKFPDGWTQVTLQSIASWGSGGTPSRSQSEYYNGEIPWIKTGDLGPRIITQASEFITEAGVKNSSAKFFTKGSVVLAMYGATIGKTSILGIDATTNQACAVGTPTAGVTSSEFLYYLLLNEKKAFIKKGKGGAQPNISQAVIKEHTVCLPPTAEQKIIADKLDDLLARVESIKTRLENIPEILKKFRQSVLSAAVSGKLTEVNASDYKEVSSVAKVIGGLTKNGKRNQISQQFPYLRVANVYENELRLDDMSVIGVQDKELDRVLLHDGDILIVEGNGSLDQIGRAAIWNGEIENCVHQNHLIKVRVNDDINSKFLLYYFMSPQGKTEIVSKATSGAGLYTLSISKISSIKVPIYTVTEQVSIVNAIEKLFSYVGSIEKIFDNTLSKINNLTQSILGKAFRGELTTQWREENPELISGINSAEALLEKITAEKLAAGTIKKRAKKSSH
ncbi:MULTISPECIES: restriction endonuclease subunit S [Providencia]|uniref:restriction endonuclease subunit S n=1 Tax=Providencia TaxID=586 RepID=UPI0013DF6190|nr:MULTISPECIES: restriction endonuclease subunit S [Providencia]EIU7555394.1 restriction endonuclease subunit S [Providencia rettgeri]MCB4839047.1 restriction endonuclease subunit S [Providencia rettgeri]QIF59441.1 4'-phosphopantetheinyl transferase [Providencia sp. 1701011]QIF63475.1 4'-phosphopantetheinyl transferase [Providencia sp. 1701091]